MESFGRLLREARERKNLSPEETADITSISEQYIHALESENLSTFPGEPYTVGFLRNYSEFLELDSEYMISLLRARLIQEAPTPVELFGKRRPAYFVPLVVLCILVFLGGGGVLAWYKFRPQNTPPDDGTTISNASGGRTHRLSLAPFSGRIYEGDMLVVPFPDGDVELTVTGTLGSLSLRTPLGVQDIELGEERELDIDEKNAGGEIIVFVSDISKSNGARGAEIRATVKPETIAETSAELVEDGQGNFFTVLETKRAYPFVVNVSFRGACLMRYQSDRNETRLEYHTNENTITVPPDAGRPANNAIRFWVSNNSAVRMQIVAGGEKYDIDQYITRLGRVVAVYDILWVRDKSGTFRLAVREID
jgi:cytoskeletal protein RodZ